MSSVNMDAYKDNNTSENPDTSEHLLLQVRGTLVHHKITLQDPGDTGKHQ